MYRIAIFTLGLLLTSSAFARGGGHSSSGSHSSSHATSHTSTKATSYGYSNPSTTSVHGYTKKDGTYVAGYKRTTENHSKVDNWSAKGNINPYTGKAGTKDPNQK
jgi:PKD repeat protein